MNAASRAIFLDRDGVLNRALLREGRPYPPSSLVEVEILPGVKDALQALKDAGFLLIVVTNQPDVARGTVSRNQVEEINRFLADNLILDEFRTCYHDDSDACNCRKPAPGALLAAAREHRLNLDRSYMVGDRWRDIEAGQRAGCKTIFLDYGYKEPQPKAVDHRVQNLVEATTIILKEFQ